ncbi:hypothetical protein IWW36_005011, partial [Coemansia brasiliensis]
IRWYAEKCKELEDMANRYSNKCQEYDRLLVRYKQLQEHRKPSPQPADKRTANLTSLSSRQGPPAKIYTFEDFDELEKKMRPPGSANRGKRSHGGILVSPTRNGTHAAGSQQAAAFAMSAADTTTPTKKARKEALGTGRHSLLSSPPPLHFKGSRTFVQRNEGQRLLFSPEAAIAAGGVKCSSQETHLDSSDMCMPEDSVVELCPASDDGCSSPSDSQADTRDSWREMLDRIDDVPKEKHVQQTKSLPKQKQLNQLNKPTEHSVRLQRILEAIGDCEPCRAFYSTPGLALPTRDPTTLCTHRKDKGKAGSSAPELKQTPRQTNRPSTSKSERRPSTPEHFWDIDYFPAIRTAGPEIMRKSRR